MAQTHDNLIIGASFAGLGLAHGNPGSVIVESSICLGAEFINAINPGTGWESRPRSDAAAELLLKIKQHGILEAGKIHIPALAPVICDWSIAKGLKLRLATEILDVKTIGTGFLVTIFDMEGKHEIFTSRIIDTTKGFYNSGFSGKMPEVLGKRLNAILHSDKGNIQSGKYGGIEIREGFYTSEAIAMFRLNSDCDWAEARRILHSSWNARPSALKEWKIASVATQFDLKMLPGKFKKRNNWIHMPSHAYNNPVEAYDHGYVANHMGGR